MDLNDRLTWMLFGSALGFLLGYLVRYKQTIDDIKETVYEVDDIVKTQLGESESRGRHTGAEPKSKRTLPWRNLVLALVLGLTLYASIITQKTNNDLQASYQDDLVARCVAGVDSRSAQRDIAQAVYNLAVGAVERNKGGPPRSEYQIRQINSFITRANDFRSDTFSKIKPSKGCREYVTDDIVTPPTPDTPLLTLPGDFNE